MAITKAVLESNHIFELDIQRGLIGALRCIIYGLSMTSLRYKHTSDIFKAYRMKSTIEIENVPFPDYLGHWQERAGLVLAVCLVLMLAMELFCGAGGSMSRTDGSLVSLLPPHH